MMDRQSTPPPSFFPQNLISPRVNPEVASFPSAFCDHFATIPFKCIETLDFFTLESRIWLLNGRFAFTSLTFLLVLATF
jgi:hypothetical protein